MIKTYVLRFHRKTESALLVQSEIMRSLSCIAAYTASYDFQLLTPDGVRFSFRQRRCPWDKDKRESWVFVWMLRTSLY